MRSKLEFEYGTGVHIVDTWYGPQVPGHRRSKYLRYLCCTGRPPAFSPLWPVRQFMAGVVLSHHHAQHEGAPQYASKHHGSPYFPDPCMHIRELPIQPLAIVAPPSSLGRASLARFQGSSLAHSKLNLVTFFIEPNVWSVSGRYPSRPSLFVIILCSCPSTALSSE